MCAQLSAAAVVVVMYPALVPVLALPVLVLSPSLSGPIPILALSSFWPRPVPALSSLVLASVCPVLRSVSLGPCGVPRYIHPHLQPLCDWTPLIGSQSCDNMLIVAAGRGHPASRQTFGEL